MYKSQRFFSFLTFVFVNLLFFSKPPEEELEISLYSPAYVYGILSVGDPYSTSTTSSTAAKRILAILRLTKKTLFRFSITINEIPRKAEESFAEIKGFKLVIGYH